LIASQQHYHQEIEAYSWIGFGCFQNEAYSLLQVLLCYYQSFFSCFWLQLWR